MSTRYPANSFVEAVDMSTRQLELAGNYLHNYQLVAGAHPHDASVEFLYALKHLASAKRNIRHAEDILRAARLKPLPAPTRVRRAVH